jgi:formiminoglutamase
MTLPLLLSVPHAGLHVPEALRDRCMLTEAEIIADGDEGAAEIYRPLEAEVAAFVTTDIARAVLDINRAEGDFRKDGIVKTHTCWDVPIWRTPLTEAQTQDLIAQHHRPYHARLTELASTDFVLAIDCHTMAAKGPPVAPDPGATRPLICLGNQRGQTCSEQTMERLARCLEDAFQKPIARNEPFAGGYVVRKHGSEMPWIQLELSRTSALSNERKRTCILEALRRFCA